MSCGAAPHSNRSISGTAEVTSTIWSTSKDRHGLVPKSRVVDMYVLNQYDSNTLFQAVLVTSHDRSSQSFSCSSILRGCYGCERKCPPARFLYQFSETFCSYPRSNRGINSKNGATNMAQ